MNYKPDKHIARKRFGQNFLHDQNIIDRIISSIAPAADQHVVEIGPGKGALTEQLVHSVNKLDVIELDRDLLPNLETQFYDCDKFFIHNEDALKFDFSQLLLSSPGSTEDTQGYHKLRLVGNLPYNISTPLIFHLLDNIELIDDMHFMLQKEVVDRLTARPGTKSYGRLSILVQYFCMAERLFIVPPGAFTPQPKVDSAIVQLIPRKSINETMKLKQATPSDLAYIARAAFAQRRKTLRNNLKNILSSEQISQCDIDPARRAETLEISEFVALTNQYAQLPAA